MKNLKLKGQYLMDDVNGGLVEAMVFFIVVFPHSLHSHVFYTLSALHMSCFQWSTYPSLTFFTLKFTNTLFTL